ncbi:unnamed protein product [Brassica oleracea]
MMIFFETLRAIRRRFSAYANLVEEEAHEETEEEAQEDETAIQVVCVSMPIHKSLNLYVLCHYIYVGIIVCRTWFDHSLYLSTQSRNLSYFSWISSIYLKACDCK